MNAKSNKPMRAAGILLIAAMLTTCMTAGTFAKYTTSASGSDAARVAKFGVVTQIDGSLFGEEYAGVDATTSPDEPIGYTGRTVNEGTVQVYAQGTNVVAPGTKNDTGLAISLTGTPEVDVKISINGDHRNIYLKAGTYAYMIPVTLTADTWTADTYYVSEIVTDTRNRKVEIFTLADTFDEDANYFTIKRNSTFTTAKDYFPVVFDYTYTENGVSKSLFDNDDLFDEFKGAFKTYMTNYMKYHMGIDDYITPDSVFEDPHTYNTLSYINYLAHNTAANYGNNGLGQSYTAQANTDLSTVMKLPNGTLTWEWAFESGHDEEDTFLGDVSAYTSANASGYVPVVLTDDSTQEYTAVKCNNSDNDDYINTYLYFTTGITVTQVD